MADFSRHRPYVDVSRWTWNPDLGQKRLSIRLSRQSGTIILPPINICSGDFCLLLPLLHDSDRNIPALCPFKCALLMLWRFWLDSRKPHLCAAVGALRMQDLPRSNFRLTHRSEIPKVLRRMAISFFWRELCGQLACQQAAPSVAARLPAILKKSLIFPCDGPDFF